ncbi:MAG: FAD-dependent oxidoreductase [Myxococcota bacterium]
MYEELLPLSVERLVDWMRRERAARGTIFGLHQDLFEMDLAGKPYGLSRRGSRLDAPIGVAAGPHSQLAANIVSAWLCGARFIELKTVQVLDELDIPRPCIDMADEGYNVEWSQELTIDESASEYECAWTLIRILQHEAGLIDGPESGFIMDLSAGYDLEGIKSAKVQGFLDRLTRSNEGLKDKLEEAARVYPKAAEIPLPERLAGSITLSTMHGCPPDEIERIGRFLLEERELHTTVKLNPTLLGPEMLRGILNDELGFETEVPDEAFEHDTKWEAALEIIESLAAVAEKKGLSFGVKLTNTLECVNKRGLLPGSPMSYMSGRALHPISVKVAERLQEAFGGRLDVSFAGGADCRNVSRLVAAGLYPVTVCSDLLRPGGYQRLRGYLQAIEEAMEAAGAADLADLARRTARDETLSVEQAALKNLKSYSREVVSRQEYRKETYPDRTIKTDRPLPAFDCIKAPCVHTCPAGQDVPAYMSLTEQGRFDEALAAIHFDNPFPNVTGMVCDQTCRTRCTRVNYEEPLRIRDVKRTLAHRATPGAPPASAGDAGKRVAIVGAGPAGLSCAYYLRLSGVRAEVYEAKPFVGGMMADAIPLFRLEQADLDRDMARLEAAGVKIRTGVKVDREMLEKLRDENDLVFVGIGAQVDRSLGIPGEDLEGVRPALRFLSAVRRGERPDIGGEVVVVGGGNTAMDAARTALRLMEPGGKVHLVYRRTRAEMPAAREELEAIEEEKVVVHELLAPASIERRDGRLSFVCKKMRLGAPDSSGRPRPEPIPGETETFVCDTLVPAVGQRMEGGLLVDEDLPEDRFDRDSALEASLAKVMLGGDVLRGPATLIQAIADGRRAADLMLASFGLEKSPRTPRRESALSTPEFQERASTIRPALVPPESFAKGPGDFGLVVGELSPEEAGREASRCLDCATRCDVCVSVCPNRANVGFEVGLRRVSVSILSPAPGGFELIPDGELIVEQRRQTANMVDLCNACGNCATFCPTAGAPFRDKPRLALQRETYEGCSGSYLLERDEAGNVSIRRRDEEGEELLRRNGSRLVYETAAGRVVMDAASFEVKDAVFSGQEPAPIALRRAAEMAVLLDALAEHPLVESSGRKA